MQMRHLMHKFQVRLEPRNESGNEPLSFYRSTALSCNSIAKRMTRLAAGKTAKRIEEESAAREVMK